MGQKKIYRGFIFLDHQNKTFLSWWSRKIKLDRFLLTHSVYIYIYIYICIFRQHFFVNANFIKHNRHFMSTYFLLDPFEFPYYFYRILGELVWKLILLSVGCRFLICNASRIWSLCLLFWCSNIVVLFVRIFRSCVVGHECFF